MGLFGPKKITEKTYQQAEKDLYVYLETLVKVLQDGEKDEKYYYINSGDKAYKQPFQTCFGLVKFYTAHIENNKSFQFKRNFLLSKTRGIFSNQRKQNNMFLDTYEIKREQIDALPQEYLKMFKLELDK